MQLAALAAQIARSRRVASGLCGRVGHGSPPGWSRLYACGADYRLARGAATMRRTARDRVSQEYVDAGSRAPRPREPGDRAMPDTEFATSAIAGADRYEQWRAALSDAFGPFEVHHGRRPVRRPRALRAARQPAIQRPALPGTEARTHRRQRLAAGPGVLHLRPAVGRPLAVVQQGREFQVEPGCVYLMNQSLPYQPPRSAPAAIAA